MYHHCAELSKFNLGAKWHKKGRKMADSNSEKILTENDVGVKKRCYS